MSNPTGYSTGSLVYDLLDGLKVHLNITGTASDVELAGILSAAQGVVEAMLPAPLEPASVVEVFPAGLVLVLRRAPVLSVDSVTATGRPLPLVVGTDAIADLDTGIIRILPTVWGASQGTLSVAYTYGWWGLPDSLRLALFIVAAHLWETQRGASGLPMPGSDSTPGMGVGMGYALPNRALELIAPFRRGPRV